MHLVPYITDTHYRTPPPQSRLEEELWRAVGNSNSSISMVQEILRRCSEELSAEVDGGLLGAGAVDVAVARNDLALLAELLKFRHWCWDYCGPVAVAVYYDHLEAMQMLLADERIDPNTGCPVAVAVKHGRMRCLEELVRVERINCNRGNPFWLATTMGNLQAVKMLSDIPTTHVNKFVQGLTPLCAAIRSNRMDIVCHLLSNPRIDVNKGFHCTPLQLATGLLNVEVVGLLLSRCSIVPSKAIGLMGPPVQLAIEADAHDLVRLLLSDPRVVVPPAVIDALEEANNTTMLNTIAVSSSYEFRMGHLWNCRFLFAFICTVTVFFVGFFDLVFVVVASLGGDRILPAAVFATHSIAGFVVFFAGFYRRHLRSTVPFALVLVPFAPLFEFASCVGLVRVIMSVRPDVFLREQLFLRFYFVCVMKLRCCVLPLCVLRVLTLAAVYRELFGNVALCLTFYVFQGLAMFGLDRVRLQGDIKNDEYVPLRDMAV